RRGAQVTLVSGPVTLAAPAGVRRIDVTSALEMQAAVMSEIKSVSSRVEMAWPDSLAEGQQLGKDYLDRTTLKAMPKVKRS
ncbi:phosphopantothenoylcysteine decarboxylase, partial [Pantoea agglomerans]|uniref:phosphopantothenoylcysteine decarboxylase n=1 Tax=Enterobacter agglomerans TaxID=549 RepID=UPI001F5E22C8